MRNLTSLNPAPAFSASFRLAPALFALLVLAVTCGPGTPGARAGQTVPFANGITARVHSAAEISASLQATDKGLLTLNHPAVGQVVLRDDADVRVPYSVNQVLAALEVMQVQTSVTVDVFILPATPDETGSSFARRGAILLAPGTGPIDGITQATIVTHEMGHVLTWAFMDEHPLRWDAYMEMRGLDPVRNGPAARHADRAREILAEDIRFLFGGSLATSSGSIENRDLETPDHITGLKELLAGFFAEGMEGPVAIRSSAFPNPANPMTTIEMVLPEGTAAGGPARLDIYDIRGMRVRTVTGGYLANGRVSLQWDGATDRGGAASSGRYFYTLRMGSVQARGAVTLVR